MSIFYIGFQVRGLQISAVWLLCAILSGSTEKIQEETHVVLLGDEHPTRGSLNKAVSQSGPGEGTGMRLGVVDSNPGGDLLHDMVAYHTQQVSSVVDVPLQFASTGEYITNVFRLLSLMNDRR